MDRFLRYSNGKLSNRKNYHETSYSYHERTGQVAGFNKEMGEFDQTSIFETEGSLELEGNGRVKNLHLPRIQKLILILWRSALAREKLFLQILKD